MSPRTIVAAVIGAVLFVIGVVALASPITADDGTLVVECGTGFTGPGEEAALIDAARDVYRDVTGGGISSTYLANTCADKIGWRRVWAYPVGVVGLVALAGAVLSWRRSTSR